MPKKRRRNPSRNPLKLYHFYQTGLQDVANVISPDDFELHKVAKQVVEGQDRGAAIRAAVDVYMKEAEENGSKEEWKHQNKALIKEAEEDGLSFEDVYSEWWRGWRDGAIGSLDQDLNDEITRYLEEQEDL
jgi:hypothetical protein